MESNVTYKVQKRIIIGLFLVIPLLFVCVFFIYPTLGLIFTSFTEWKGYGGYKFYGIKNYIDVFMRPNIFGVIVHNMAYLVSGIMQLICGIFLAILINKKFFWKEFLQGYHISTFYFKQRFCSIHVWVLIPA